jgi:hypothetical protein
MTKSNQTTFGTFKCFKTTQDLADSYKPSRCNFKTTFDKDLVATYEQDRVCACGTVLSIYNDSNICALCERKQLLKEYE